MTSPYTLPPTDWNASDRRNSGVMGFRATSPRIATPPPNKSCGVTFYSPLSRWDVSHNESIGSRGTCGFGSNTPRTSYITSSGPQGGSGSVTPLESWIKGHQQASAAFRSNTPRHSYITAPVLQRSQPQTPRRGGASVDPPRGAPQSNAPLSCWVKEPGRRSSSFAPSAVPQRHSYIPAASSTNHTRGGVSSYAPLDDWGRSKTQGRPSAGMISKSPRHSYIPSGH
jgi:hypothetical protein